LFLKNILLNDFRNYDKILWEPCNGINFITGSNAQGKTNLLEAVFFSGLGYSFRKKDRDVIRWGKTHSSVRATYFLKDMPVDIVADINEEGKKKILINGAEDGRKFLPGRFGIVLFRPDDLETIKGPPARRREFIDNEIGMIEPVYRRRLQQYRRVVEQRNNLLRVGGGKDLQSLKIWNEQFYRYGAEVLSGRIKLLKKYSPLVREMYASIAGNHENLEIKYLSTVKISGGTDTEQIINDFIFEGKTREKEEFYKKQTVIGPHRDDIVFLINKQDARHYGSQGQIRSIVLALKTAQLQLFRLETGEHPILLLDDVLMELDDRRQHYLLQLIAGKYQSFITSTTLDDSIKRYVDRVYFVNKGTVKEES